MVDGVVADDIGGAGGPDVPFGVPDAPGICPVACWATRADEFRRGLRVDVPIIFFMEKRKNIVSLNLQNIN